MTASVPRLPDTILALPGDGIGPEIMDVAIALLDAVGDVSVETGTIGGRSIDEHGVALTDEVIEQCKGADAVLLGAVGGPKWDTTDPGRPRPEQGLLGIRKALGHEGQGLYANIRPVRPQRALLSASPLKEERIRGTDMVIVRELTGGIYYGPRGTNSERAFDTCVYSPVEVERIALIAFDLALERSSETGRVPKVTSVDKANVLDTSRLWREVVEAVAAFPKYADVELEHLLVDNAAAQLVARPSEFDVILAENSFGDILSDEAAMLTGSMGMLPSASIDHRPPHLFEPVHGSAPDIAGLGIANPLAMFLTVAMMLRIGLGRPDDARRVEDAVEATLDAGYRTPDLVHGTEVQLPTDETGSPAICVTDTHGMTDAVIAEYLRLQDARAGVAMGSAAGASG
jgi:3-isopropylmalate dehydrogenase